MNLQSFEGSPDTSKLCFKGSERKPSLGARDSEGILDQPKQKLFIDAIPGCLLNRASFIEFSFHKSNIYMHSGIHEMCKNDFVLSW